MEEEFSDELKIPEERIAVLIGEDGVIKKEIENQTQTAINITSDGEVTIRGNDGLNLHLAHEIVKAIGRGFNPKIALLLTKTDYSLELIELRDIAGKNKDMMQRYKGRIIGQQGKAREELERLTDTNISVYGKTVAIIGESGQALLARKAIGMLIDGAMHRSVYRYLEKQKKEQLFG